MTRPTTAQVIDTIILPQLNKPRQIGANRWKACCPAHDDKTPSFDVSISSRGNILMKCWAGCEIGEICNSLGMAVADLFADDNTPPGKPLQPSESDFFIALYKSAIRKGNPVTAQETARYKSAIARRAGGAR